MKKVLFISSVLVLFCVMLFVSQHYLSAQTLELPKLSPKASVMQTVGLTEITISYHRPGVKGRVIWGDLVPYDKVWRTGANNATTITFSTDVKIEANELKAGTYAIFTIPGKEEWVFIFSKQTEIWGAYEYKEGLDALRIKLKPAGAPDCERMLFSFADLTDESVKVVLQWEKLMVSFAVTVDTKGTVLKNIEKTIDRYWTTPYSAANYALKNEMPDKAKQWVDVSVSIKPTYWNMLLKAKIYKQSAKTKIETNDAIKMLEKAILLIKDMPQEDQSEATEAPKLLDEWKPKK